MGEETTDFVLVYSADANFFRDLLVFFADDHQRRVEVLRLVDIDQQSNLAKSEKTT